MIRNRLSEAFILLILGPTPARFPRGVVNDFPRSWSSKTLGSNRYNYINQGRFCDVFGKAPRFLKLGGGKIVIMVFEVVTTIIVILNSSSRSLQHPVMEVVHRRAEIVSQQ